MKKILLIMIALVMVFALASCGITGKTPSEGGTGESGVSQGSAVSTGGDTNKTDLTTVAGFLSAFGLSEDDVKCAKFTRFDRTTYNNETQVIKEIGAYASEKLTEAEGKEWLTKIISKLNSLSDDGKIVNSHADADGAALTADFIMSQSMFMGSGSYEYNGKTVDVLIAFYPTAKDNTDPDEAMPSCTIHLEVN